MTLGPLFTVDLGNTQAKLGYYSSESVASFPPWTPESIRRSSSCTATPSFFPTPTFRCALRNDRPLSREILEHIPWEYVRPLTTKGSRTAFDSSDSNGSRTWALASVNRPAATRLVDWIRTHCPEDPILLLAATDVPISVDVAAPDRVGIDRLLDAVAANAQRRFDRPAVVVDAGSAITVDYVTSDGTFRGGAILPGTRMAARALNHFTDLLPLVEVPESLEELHHLSAVGRSTEEAIRSGLFHGTLGAIRELITTMSDTSPDVFLTGGTGRIAAELLGESSHYDPDLTLAGIVLTVRAIWSDRGGGERTGHRI